MPPLSYKTKHSNRQKYALNYFFGTNTKHCMFVNLGYPSVFKARQRVSLLEVWMAFSVKCLPFARFPINSFHCRYDVWDVTQYYDDKDNSHARHHHDGNAF